MNPKSPLSYVSPSEFEAITKVLREHKEAKSPMLSTIAPDEVEVITKALREYRESKARKERIASVSLAFREDIQNCVDVFGLEFTKKIVRAALKSVETDTIIVPVDSDL